MGDFIFNLEWNYRKPNNKTTFKKNKVLTLQTFAAKLR